MVVQLLDRAIPAPRSIRRLAHKPRRFATPLGRRVGTQRDGYDFRRVIHQAFYAHAPDVLAAVARVNNCDRSKQQKRHAAQNTTD